MFNKKIKLLSLSCLILFSISCQSVKEYQKARLNDYNMDPSSHSSEKLESEGVSFREGSSGGEGGKTGGGCGCN